MPKELTLAKVEKEIEAGDFWRARDRLHGLIASYPDDLSLRRKLGDVYWKLSYPAMAGRYWFLEANKTQEMDTACESFKTAFGNDPLRLLLALKFRGSVDPLADTYAGKILLDLHEKARKEHYFYNDFRKPGKDKYRPSVLPNTNNKIIGKLIEVGFKAGVAIIVIILVGIFTLGIVTLIRMIFQI